MNGRGFFKDYRPRWASVAMVVLAVTLPLITVFNLVSRRDGLAWRGYLVLGGLVAAALVGSAWCIGALAYLNRAMKRADGLCCIHCGRSLAHNDTDICLECGQPIDPARAWIATREARLSEDRSAVE